MSVSRYSVGLLCLHLAGISLTFFSVFANHDGRDFCVFQVSAIRYIGCYPTTIGNRFLLWLFARSPPMRLGHLPLKMGIPCLGVAFSEVNQVIFGKRLLPPKVKLNKQIDQKIDR